MIVCCNHWYPKLIQTRLYMALGEEGGTVKLKQLETLQYGPKANRNARNAQQGTASRFLLKFHSVFVAAIR